MKWIPLSIALLCIGNSLADALPQLNEKPWVGWYTGYEERKFRFGVNQNGEAVLIPIDKRKREPMSPKYWIEIQPAIEEVREAGRVVSKRPTADGWEALTEASATADKIAFRGTVSGGATFEVNLEVSRGEIRAGGRILEKGELTKYPLRLALRVRVPNAYPYVTEEEKLQERARRDKVRIERADGEKLTLGTVDPVQAETELNGTGVRNARIELDGFDGYRIDLDAGTGGLFEFWNGEKRPLYKGFTFGWKPDPEKDPEGRARFSLKFG